MDEPSPAEDWRGTCAGCGEIVGAFEPVVVLTRDGHATETSLAAARRLIDDGRGSALFHDACFRSARA